MARSGVWVAFCARGAERVAVRVRKALFAALGEDAAPPPAQIETVADEETLQRCRTLVVLIDARWCKALRKAERAPETPANGLLAQALAAPDIQVVPVLIDNAVLPDRFDLPGPLRGLTVLAPARVRSGCLKADCAALAEAANAARQNGFFNVPEALRPPPPQAVSLTVMALRACAVAACIAGAVYIEWRAPLF